MKQPIVSSRAIQGFSLVELMVAVTIGLIILAAVSGIFVTSKSTYNTTDSLARLQENARFAVHYLSRDLRLAGFAGCLDDLQSVNSTINGSSFAFQNLSTPIEGVNDKPATGTSTWYPSGATVNPIPYGSTTIEIKPGTDAITLRFADDANNISITRAMPNTSSELNVSAVTGLADGDIVMISDCSSADIMQITSVQASALKIQHNPGGSLSPGNSTQVLSKQYVPPAKLMKFKTVTYFITLRLDGVPVLMMQENGGNAVELIEGVEEMQILYGKDTDTTPDGVPNVYLRAGQSGLTTPNDWTRVHAVRIALLIRTVTGKEEYTNSDTYSVLDKSVTAPGDRHHRRVFTFTLQPRNLIPSTVPIS
jgi:type IV pilus assembly protein PilW